MKKFVEWFLIPFIAVQIPGIMMLLAQGGPELVVWCYRDVFRQAVRLVVNGL